MFFRNLTFLRFPTSFGALFPTSAEGEFDNLHLQLQECALKPVGALELASYGFVPPLGRGAESYTHRIGQACHVTVGGEEKILPAAVINDLLQKKLAEVEEREGRSPGGRACWRIKEDLVQELLPRAFVKPGRLDAYFDFERGFIAVDTTSHRAAERLVSEVRNATGSFPALPLNAEIAPRTVLTGWLAGEPLPDGMHLGDECELRDPSDKGAVVRIQHLELAGDEVQQHLGAGMQCTRLALTWQDRVSFVLGEDLSLRRVKFLDGAVESLEAAEREDLAAEMDARFALMAGEVGILFDVLEAALKISRADADTPAPAPSRKRGAAGSARAAADRLANMAADQGVTMEMVLPDGESITIGGPGTDDPLYERAREIVIQSGNATISRVQRVLKIGYNRAARLVEALEFDGVVSPPKSDGSRTLLSPKGTPCPT